MREIKFRVYDFERKEMITHFKGARIDYVLHYWETRKKVSEPMQYTGLKDKNGVEIYEGDIIKITTESNSWVSKVGNSGVWHEIIINDLDLDIDFLSINYAYDVLDCEIEVIGNIYENKDLLSEVK